MHLKKTVEMTLLLHAEIDLLNYQLIYIEEILKDL